MAQKIKRNDMVKVIAGKDIDKEGKVLSVDAKNHKVVVEGINMATKHTKPSMQNQAGGIVQEEAPVFRSLFLLSSHSFPAFRFRSSLFLSEYGLFSLLLTLKQPLLLLYP